MINPCQTEIHRSISDGGRGLSVSNLDVATTGGALILDSVSLDISRGEVLALVGESGSGKTSFGLALLGYARPGTEIRRGSVALDGVEIIGLRPKELRKLRGRRIAYVPQDPTASLDPRKRIRAQIMEMLEEHPEARGPESGQRIVNDLLDMAGLSADQGFGYRYPFELSGGQQQRVVIAMALACRPDYVVLDEPTTGLDVTTQRRILDLVRSLARSTGAGFIHITHDLAVVSDLADRVAVMYAGRIVEVASKVELFSRPLHPYTIQLLDSAPRLEAGRKLRGIPGTAPAVGNRSKGCSFMPRCSLATDACWIEPQAREWRVGHMVRCHNVRVNAVRQAAPTEPRVIVGKFAGAPLLDVSDLQAAHGRGGDRRRVIDGVSFTLSAGECLALVGESGSGKTTLGRCLAGLHVADAGSFRFRGQTFPYALHERPEEVRRGIQMVFQNPDRCLNPVRNIAETLARSIRMAGETSPHRIRENAESLLERVGLPGRTMQRYPRELSGGERQRIAIAAALALRPGVLVCDEITSALDVSVQAAVVNLLDDLRRDGLALLFITHNLMLVASIADRVLVLQGGYVREQGRACEVLTEPEHPYTKWLLSDLPQIGRPNATAP